MKIVDITPRQDYTLLIRTDQGVTGSFDVRPYLTGEAFRPLRDWREFRRVHNRGYFVEWECGADLSADTLEAHLKTSEAALS